jgi:hypothetical protein
MTTPTKCHTSKFTPTMTTPTKGHSSHQATRTKGYCSIRPLHQRHSFYRASFQIHWNSNIQVKIDTQKRSHPYYKATFSLQKGCPYKRKIIVLQMYVYSAVLLQYFKLLTTSNQHIQKSGIWYTSIIKEEFEDTKEVIRIHKSKKDRQHNG